MSSEVLVLATSAGLFAIGSAGALLHRHPVAMLMAVEIMLNAANLLIVLGVGAAYLLSAAHTLSGAGPLYYDTAAAILVLVTVGSWLESQARSRAFSAAAGLVTALGRTPAAPTADRAASTSRLVERSLLAPPPACPNSLMSRPDEPSNRGSV